MNDATSGSGGNGSKGRRPGERDLEPRHPIRVVARRTGLTPALLRAWEKRYSVVAPSRTDGGQRLYSDDDVHRLSLLHRVVDEGRSISQVAHLSSEELERLAREDQEERAGPPTLEPVVAASVGSILSQGRRAVAEMDPGELERILTRGAMALPIPSLVEDVLLPLLEGIGVSWRKGEFGPAHEHLASGVIRRFLEWLLGTVGAVKGAPVLLSGTPAGEKHEFGALLSAVTAGAEGWKAVFMGPDLPAPEIAAAALRLEAEIVALSVVDPSVKGGLAGEIRELRNRLPADVRLVVGGPAILMEDLRRIGDGVEVLEGIPALREMLRRGGMAG